MIHHYTSVASLAMILKNKTLRFTRLDQFDDVQESYSYAGINLGLKLFASCWVKDVKEDIPQWAMYGDRLEGVRISLPDNPFIWNKININYTSGTKFLTFEKVPSPFTEAQMLGNGYMIVPPSPVNSFGSDVVYRDDREAYFESVIKKTEKGINIPGGAYKLGIIKGKQWEFQREYRFIISAIKAPSLEYLKDRKRYLDEMLELFEQPGWLSESNAPSVTYLDLNVSVEALELAEITLGPLASEATRIIVESLVSAYAPKIKLKDSELKGALRGKRN